MFKDEALGKQIVEIVGLRAKLSLTKCLMVFFRETLPKKAKLNECVILNLDSSSGDGTHWLFD